MNKIIFCLIIIISLTISTTEIDQPIAQQFQFQEQSRQPSDSSQSSSDKKIQKQQIVGETSKIIILMVGVLLICFEGIVYFRSRRLKNIINFAFFKADQVQSSVNKFGNLEQVQPQPPGQSNKEVQVKTTKDNSQQIQDNKTRHRRKRKTDRLNTRNNNSRDNQGQQI